MGPLLDEKARAVLLGACLEDSGGQSGLGAPQWLQRAIADWHTDTFFRVRHTERTYRLASWVRRGDPLADLIFNACMTGFIKELRKCLVEDGLLVSMQDLDGNPVQPAWSQDDQDRGGDLDLDGPRWVDDHAVYTSARDPNDVVHNIRAIMVTLEKVAARHGFSLNTKKVKTECVVTIAGKGIMEARRALDWQEDHAQLQYGDGGILRLIDRYKHLGTLHDKHLCRMPEVVRRAKAARTVIAAISKRVLRNTLLRLPVRRQAALACADGVLFSAAGWCSVEARVAFAQWPQVSFAPLPCICETRARRSDRCGAPHAAQSAFHVACHAGGLIAIPTKTSSPCSARSLLRLPSASHWTL